ncbi:mechanosensitive ion channel family protein [Mangrovactinospora gilvigrisea]|nr:mechanosensitive ion channel family protein [Mangrovactinospora gilvigrisea]
MQQNTSEAASWLSRSWMGWAESALRIVVIMVIALVLRALVRRLIAKVVRGAVRGARSSSQTSGSAAAGAAAGNRGTGLALANALLASSERRRQRAEAIGSVLRSVASFVIMGTCALSVLSVLKINLAPLLASAGVAGVAVGFGARNLVTDFLSGVFMILEDQYGVGDVIDAGVATGEVVEVGLRVTKLRGANGEIWYVRNGEIKRIGNMSQGWATATVGVQVAAGADLERVRDVIVGAAEEMAKEQPWDEYLWQPVEVLGVSEVTADSLTLDLTAQTAPGRQASVERELRARVRTAFREAGIPITGLESESDPAIPAQPVDAAPPSALANPTSPQYKASVPLEK